MFSFLLWYFKVKVLALLCETPRDVVSRGARLPSRQWHEVHCRRSLCHVSWSYWEEGERVERGKRGKIWGRRGEKGGKGNKGKVKGGKWPNINPSFLQSFSRREFNSITTTWRRRRFACGPFIFYRGLPCSLISLYKVSHNHSQNTFLKCNQSPPPRPTNLNFVGFLSKIREKTT